MLLLTMPCSKYPFRMNAKIVLNYNTEKHITFVMRRTTYLAEYSFLSGKQQKGFLGSSTSISPRVPKISASPSTGGRHQILSSKTPLHNSPIFTQKIPVKYAFPCHICIYAVQLLKFMRYQQLIKDQTQAVLQYYPSLKHLV